MAVSKIWDLYNLRSLYGMRSCLVMVNHQADMNLLSRARSHSYCAAYMADLRFYNSQPERPCHSGP